METQVTDASKTGLGRSGPRSRDGCQCCKQRRVRCNEQRPACSACTRLKLDCIYKAPSPRRTRSISTVSSPAAGGGASRRKRHDSGNSTQPLRRESLHHQQRPPISPQAASSHQYPSPTQSHSITPKPISESNGSLANSSPSYNAHVDNHIPQGTLSASVIQPHQCIPSVQSLDYFDTLFDTCFEMPNMSNAFSTFAFTDAQQYHQPLSDSSPSAFYGSSDLLQANLQLDNNSDELPSNFLSSSLQGQTSLGFTTTAILPVSHEMHATFDYTSLTLEQQQHLRLYFKRSIRPPASLVSVDPLGWLGMQRYLIHLASGNRAVANALFALALLLSSPNRNDHSLGTDLNSRSTVSNLQKASRREIEAELMKSGTVENGDGLLAAIFLLAWCDILYDEHEATHAAFPSEVAESVITAETNWNTASKCLLQWLNSLDAKASHLGGRQLLSPKSLEVSLQHRFGTHQVEATAERLELTSEQESDEDSIERDVATQISGTPNNLENSGQTLIEESRARGLTLTKNIKLKVFNTVLQPALEWHLVSQSYSRRIGLHDRHHRTRNTVDDEFEVTTAYRGFENDLQNLWNRRPKIMYISVENLEAIVCKKIALKLVELFSVYAASFWVHFIYIHRVAWWNLPHSDIAKKAVNETWRALRRSRGLPDAHTDDKNAETSDTSSIIHPSLMWPLFLFRCETPDKFCQDWAVAQLKALGEASSNTEDIDADSRDELPSFRLAQKGAQNAMRASLLLKELVQRQTRLGARVDGKYCTSHLNCSAVISRLCETFSGI